VANHYGDSRRIGIESEGSRIRIDGVESRLNKLTAASEDEADQRTEKERDDEEKGDNRYEREREREREREKERGRERKRWR